MSYEILKKGDEFKKVTKVITDDSTVHVRRTVRPDKKSTERYVIDVVYDYSDVTHEELLELATRSIVIDDQRNWRKAAETAIPDEDRWTNEAVRSVREMLDEERTRGPVDPKKVVVSNWSKMSKEDKAEMLRQLQEELTKE